MPCTGKYGETAFDPPGTAGMQLGEYRGGSSCEMRSVGVSLLAPLCLDENYSSICGGMIVGPNKSLRTQILLIMHA